MYNTVALNLSSEKVNDSVGLSLASSMRNDGLLETLRQRNSSIGIGPIRICIVTSAISGPTGSGGIGAAIAAYTRSVTIILAVRLNYSTLFNF